MSNEKLSIRLDAREDVNKRKYFIGRVQFPGEIDCREGAVFMIFVSEEGAEELQIGVMDVPNKKEKR